MRMEWDVQNKQDKRKKWSTSWQKVKSCGATGAGRESQPGGGGLRERRGPAFSLPVWSHNLILISSCPGLPSLLQLNVSFAPWLFLASFSSPEGLKIMFSVLTHLASRLRLISPVSGHVCSFHRATFHGMKGSLFFVVPPKESFLFLVANEDSLKSVEFAGVCSYGFSFLRNCYIASKCTWMCNNVFYLTTQEV